MEFGWDLVAVGSNHLFELGVDSVTVGVCQFGQVAIEFELQSLAE
jgi:hypothetical protein